MFVIANSICFVEWVSKYVTKILLQQLITKGSKHEVKFLKERK